MLIEELRTRLEKLSEKDGWRDYLDKLSDKQIIEEYADQAQCESKYTGKLRLTKVYNTGQDKRHEMSLGTHYSVPKIHKSNIRLGDIVTTNYHDVLVVTAMNITSDMNKRIHCKAEITGIALQRITNRAPKVRAKYIECTFSGGTDKVYTYRLGNKCPVIDPGDTAIVMCATGLQQVDVHYTSNVSRTSHAITAEVVAKIALVENKRDKAEKIEHESWQNLRTALVKFVSKLDNIKNPTMSQVDCALRQSYDLNADVSQGLHKYQSALKALNILNQEENKKNEKDSNSKDCAFADTCTDFVQFDSEHGCDNDACYWGRD